MNKPVVGIFSEPNFLSLSILENLLSLGCHVKVFSTDIENWMGITNHLNTTSGFQLFSIKKNTQEFESLNYTFFVCGFSQDKKIYEELKSYSKLSLKKNLKRILVFPFENFIHSKNYKIKADDNLSIVYLGDLIGPKIDLNSNLLLPSIINQAIYNKTITLNVGEVFYPLFVSDVARTLTKWLFSFGPYGHEIFILGEDTSTDKIWSELRKYIPDLKLSYNVDGEIRIIPRGFEIKRLKSSLPFVLSETMNWFRKAPKITLTRRSPFLSIVILFIFLTPFLLDLFSVGVIALGYRSFKAGNNDSAKSAILFSKTISSFGKEESAVMRYIPILGRIYDESYFTSLFLIEISDIALVAIDLSTNTSDLVTHLMGDEIYDPNMFINKMKLSLDKIYQEVSFLEAEINSEASKGGIIAGKILNKLDIGKVKNMVVYGKTILSELPNDLGVNGPRQYLVLFQNNMELRPTGGFIGSFGLLTFENGRMIDLSVSDVYSADGQLKGHVEPPAAIKKYLGEANWFLRDSNWDPDFSTSSKRAEWFLDKEIDRKVDGVIGVDLEVVKRALSITGPIFLPDYNLEVDSDNLYEKTQEEAERDFFPGSTKKASFLTALSRNLITEIEKLDSNNKLRILRGFYQDLEERHIQIYLHNDKTQEAISKLSWGGEIFIPSCGEDCYGDFVGVVEANVGVNKSNYFITRNQKLAVDIQKDKINRTLSLELTNKSPLALGERGRYKSYIRLLTPANTTVEGTYETALVKDRLESGILVEVLPGQTKKIVFKWTSPKTDTNYRLLVRKQAGTTSADTLSVAINGEMVYNSIFVKDIWTKKY